MRHLSFSYVTMEWLAGKCTKKRSVVMQAFIKIKHFLKLEWQQAGVLGRLVYLYYILFFVAEVYYVTHLNIVIMG